MRYVILKHFFNKKIFYNGICMFKIYFFSQLMLKLHAFNVKMHDNRYSRNWNEFCWFLVFNLSVLPALLL